ncbi:MAG: PilW family protein [Thermodesulfobacteriota bacterium]
MQRAVRSPKGFTLVELLVAMAMGLIVLSVMFTMFRTSSRSYTLQDYVAETQQNLRVAIYAVGRDVRMAGCGLNLLPSELVDRIQIFNGAGWSLVRAITGANSAVGPDSVEVFYGDIRSGEYDATITQPMPDASAELNCDTVTPFNDHDAVVISNGLTAALFVVSQVQAGPKKLQHNPAESIFNPPAAFKAFPTGGGYGSGSRLYNFGAFKWITYAVDSVTDPLHPRLTVNAHDGAGAQVVAENIEDLQFYYILQNGGGTHNPVGSENQIQAVRISLVARTAEQDPEANVFSPLTVEDHVIGAVPQDGYRRRVLSTEVKIRNR